MSPSSTITSPELMPTRNWMRSSSGIASLRAVIPRCTATAQATASTTLGNSINSPSPVVLTMRPLCSAIFGSDRRQPAFDPLSFHDSPPRHGSTLRRLRQPINHGSYGISGMFGLPCNTQGYRRKLVPDDHAATSHVSLRVPQDIIEAFDHLAAT